MKRLNLSMITIIILFLLSSECRKNNGDDGEGMMTQIEVFATGLENPLGIENAGDKRLFVPEQGGTIAIIDSAGNLNPVKFLDISDKVISGGEQGLLGLAFHPDFENNGWLFVNYTGENDSTFISRFTVMESNPDLVDPASEIRILVIAQPYKNHNGGNLKFGPDGYLYAGLGDGGSAGDPQNRAQDMNELLGKILRLDVNQEPIYSIPPENPFAKDESARPEIWSYGLRNPWRFSFDRLTGDLWIADVGQSRAEEINMQPFNSSGGENYGWRCYEGTEEFNTDDCGARESYNFPVYEYVHGDAECTVIGGYVYRGNEDSEYYGRYFYADFCSDRIWSLLNNSGGWTGELFGHFPGNGFSSFGEDSKGNIYIAGLASGIIYKLRL